jgi:hypothetical protein
MEHRKPGNPAPATTVSNPENWHVLGSFLLRVSLIQHIRHELRRSMIKNYGANLVSSRNRVFISYFSNSSLFSFLLLLSGFFLDPRSP